MLRKQGFLTKTNDKLKEQQRYYVLEKGALTWWAGVFGYLFAFALCPPPFSSASSCSTLILALCPLIHVSCSALLSH